MKTLTVYTKPNCGYCANAKAYLTQNDIAFTEVDISQNEEKRNWLVESGFKTLPVIYAGDAPLVNGGWSALKNMRKNEIMERLEE